MTSTRPRPGSLFEAVKVMNKILRQLPESAANTDLDLLRNGAATVRKLAAIMGILEEDAANYLADKKAAMLAKTNISEAEILDLIQKRNQARKDRDWALSDQIRDTLLEKEIELKDGPDGTTWSVRRG